VKWIFTLLLLLNIALAAVTFLQPEPRGVSAKGMPEDTGDLKIVSDIDLRVRADHQRRQQQIIEQKAAEQKAREAQANNKKTKQLNIDVNKAGCNRLGSFNNKTDAQSIASGLANYRLVSTVETETISRTVGYYALLPSIDDEKKLMSTLTEAGFDDIRKLDSGIYANSISLGLFSNEFNAVKQVRRAQKLGYIATVTPKTEETVEYWVEFNKPADFTVPMSDINNAFPGVIIKACNGIASD